MSRSRLRFGDRHGMSLMEVTLAVAIFAGVMAVTAHSLAAFYVSTDLQKQRIEALSACRSVMSFLREQRHEHAGGFPDDFLAVVTEHEEAGWPDFLQQDSDGTYLGGHAISVQCTDMDGTPATSSTNPLRVTVTSTWNDRRGRAMQAAIAGLITDQ